MKVTDPELIEVFDNFAFDETLRHTRLDARIRLMVQQTLAAVSLLAGKMQEARELLLGTLNYAPGSKDTEFLANALEMFACTDADLGDMPQAARLAGAAEALRQRAGIPLPQPDAALLERFLVPARAAMAPGMWDAELAAGRALTQEQAAGLLRSAAHRG